MRNSAETERCGPPYICSTTLKITKSDSGLSFRNIRKRKKDYCSGGPARPFEIYFGSFKILKNLWI